MIRLSDGYAMDVDIHCYTVGIPKKQVVVNKKTGESKDTEIMTDARYYVTLDQALLGWWRTMRKRALINFEGSLNDALDVIKKQDENVETIIAKIKAEIK